MKPLFGHWMDDAFFTAAVHNLPVKVMTNWNIVDLICGYVQVPRRLIFVVEIFLYVFLSVATAKKQGS